MTKKTEFKKIVGARIKLKRDAMGMNQEDLAAKLNTEQGTVARWETGVNLPRGGMKKKVADFFKISVEQLYGANSELDEFIHTSKDELAKTVAELSDRIRQLEAQTHQLDAKQTETPLPPVNSDLQQRRERLKALVDKLGMKGLDAIEGGFAAVLDNPEYLETGEKAAKPEPKGSHVQKLQPLHKKRHHG